jgi:lysophospholipase L1-like esterase
MKLAIIGDSHCREMEAHIKSQFKDLRVLNIIRGRNTSSVIRFYQASLQKVIMFDPDFILLHVGHNDMARHPTLNPHPKDSTQTTTITMIFARILQTNHPFATVRISAMFPRTHTPASLLSPTEVSKFNRDAKRHALRLRAEAILLNIEVSMNNTIWKRISKTLEESTFYLPDGYHLNDAGKLSISTAWMKDLLGLEE